MDYQGFKFNSLKECKILQNGDNKILQLSDGGENALLVGDEIAALATHIRACKADVLAEIQDIELHPCPHCGGDARIVVTKWRDADKREPAICRAQCTVCGSRTKDVEDETLADVNERGDKDAKKRVISLWNMRKR